MIGSPTTNSAVVLLLFGPLLASATPLFSKQMRDAEPNLLILVQRGFRPPPHIDVPRFEPRTIPRDPIRPDTSSKELETLFGKDYLFGKETITVQGSQYTLDKRAIDAWQTAIGTSRPPAAFIVQRLLSAHGTTSQPLYVLFTGGKKQTFFVGNGKLRDLVSASAIEWIDRGGSPPPRLTMVGDGTSQDFDAALLTMRLSHLDLQDAKLQEQTALDSLDPPPEFSDLPGFLLRSKGLPADGAAVTRAGDRYTGEYRFEKGTLRVIGSTREAVAVVLAAIRQVIREYFLGNSGGFFSILNGPKQPLSESQRAMLAAQMQERTALALHDFFLREVDIKQKGHDITVEFTVDNELMKWSVATAQMRPSRLADSVP